MMTHLTEATRAAASKFSEQSIEITVVSALAEGADRIVAEVGLETGCSLQAILPFVRAQYIRDFENSPGSYAAFTAFVERAFSVFEIDGDPNERPRAYEAAGIVMLANIDILIAIWDGDASGGIGGTAQIVSRAVADGIPVILIEPSKPDLLQWSWPRPNEVALADTSARDTFRIVALEEITESICDILAPPGQSIAVSSLAVFLAEKIRRWNFCPWYPLFLFFISGRRIKRGDFHIPTALSDSYKGWLLYFESLSSEKSQRPAIENTLFPIYNTMDALAIFYAQVYRSAYVFNFLFAAMAVMLALIGVFVHSPLAKSYLVTAELVVISSVLVTWLYGHRKQWHRRWLDYRRLAESIRQMRILALIGLSGPADRPRRTIDDPDWNNWYAWSLQRLLPLPDRIIDLAYLSAVRDVARSIEIAAQIEYHSKNAMLIEKVEHRLHYCGQILFGLTALICVMFVIAVWLFDIPSDTNSHKDIILDWLTFFTALLPTLGGALGAINVQGEFNTLFAQSKRSARRLSTMDALLASEDLAFARLCDRIQKTSDIMMSDVDEWQTVFRTRPLSLPV